MKRIPKSLFWIPCLAYLMFAPVTHAKDTLRLGILPVVDTLPTIVAVTRGLFADRGIDLKLISFQSALERDAALQAGQLDGYFGDIINTILLIHAGQKIKIVTTAYHTHPRQRMFGIVAAPASNINSISELKGKAIAISRATIIEYLLERLLEQQNLGTDFVTKEEIKKIPIRLQMLLSGQIPAALLPEPLLTLAESKGAKVLLDDRHLNTSETVLALSTSRLEQNPSLADQFRKAYEAAVARINQNPEAYKNVLVKQTRFPAFLKDVYKIPEFPPVRPPNSGDIDAAQDWLMHRHMIDKRIAYDDIVLKPGP